MPFVSAISSNTLFYLVLLCFTLSYFVLICHSRRPILFIYLSIVLLSMYFIFMSALIVVLLMFHVVQTPTIN